MRRAAAVLVSCLACTTALPAFAAASVAARLDARGVTHEVDADGDHKVLYRYSEEGRTQLVFVSGDTEEVGSFVVREVFAPAARVGRDGIDGAKALELLAESRNNKLGAWELHGDVLHFVIKLPDDADAAELESALEIAAQTADDMEIELSGSEDAF